MKKVGIKNANYITFGGFERNYCDSDIPHYNNIALSGLHSIPAGSDSKTWRRIAENAKDEIGEIIEYHLTTDNDD